MMLRLCLWALTLCGVMKHAGLVRKHFMVDRLNDTRIHGSKVATSLIWLVPNFVAYVTKFGTVTVSLIGQPLL